MMAKLRIGLIGAGRFGQTLMQIAQSLSELQVTAVYDVNAERAREVAAVAVANGEAIHVCSKLEELWSYTDAVLISTSHDTHLPNTLAAAAAGKAIFCEKPMALDVAECQSMIDAAAQHGVKLLVGQVTRLMPIMTRLRAILESGTIGRPVAAHILRSGWLERQGWWAATSTSGGMLHSHGAHIYDLLSSLFGQVISIYALAAPRIQPQVDYDDTIFSTIRYENGAIATVDASISGQMWIYEGHFICEQGSLQFALEQDGCWLTYQQRGGALIRETFGTFNQEGLDGVAIELRNFADFVLRDAPPFVTNQQALEAVALIQAAYTSVRTGTVVSLPYSHSKIREFNDHH
ncbi:MAG: Gfo/Idh/MocA family oxidoreductase [Anaerolineae bacterium]|nr:Gfo/Idh/MocA family oxidoreductase [Anaerolineae bacterium]